VDVWLWAGMGLQLSQSPRTDEAEHVVDHKEPQRDYNRASCIGVSSLNESGLCDEVTGEKSEIKAPPPTHNPDAVVVKPGWVTFNDNDGRLQADAQGSYLWIAKGHGLWEKEQRRKASDDTLSACERGGYTLRGRNVRLSYIDRMMRGTRLITASAKGPRAAGNTFETQWLRRPGETLTSVVLDVASRGELVAGVCIACAFHAGGGFDQGERHSLEEALNTQTTLYRSLKPLEQKMRKHENPKTRGLGRSSFFPQDTAILSPHVEVFRGEPCDGYPFLQETVLINAILSVSMPSGQDRQNGYFLRPEDKLREEKLLERKFTAVAQAAAISGAKVIVVPDLGSNADGGSDPKLIGKLLAECVRRNCPGVFKEIILLGSEEFTSSAIGAAAAPISDANPPVDGKDAKDSKRWDL